ncbi:unnamed protein product [Closterium sp. NIES-54]
MVHQVLQRFSFTWSSPQPTPLPTGHSLSAPPSDESVEPSGPYTELVGCLMYLMTCTRADLAYPLGLLARYVPPDRPLAAFLSRLTRPPVKIVLAPSVLTSSRRPSSRDPDEARRRNCCLHRHRPRYLLTRPSPQFAPPRYLSPPIPHAFLSRHPSSLPTPLPSHRLSSPVAFPLPLPFLRRFPLPSPFLSYCPSFSPVALLSRHPSSLPLPLPSRRSSSLPSPFWRRICHRFFRHSSRHPHRHLPITYLVALSLPINLFISQRSPGGAVSGSNPGVCTSKLLLLRVRLGGYGRTNPLHEQALLSQWSSDCDSDTSVTIASPFLSPLTSPSSSPSPSPQIALPLSLHITHVVALSPPKSCRLPLVLLSHFVIRFAIFDLDYDAILSVMYALSDSAEGDCYRYMPPDPGIAAAALGASESGTLPCTAPAEALHTFTLDSGASRCFFRDSTTLTPLPAPVPVRLADPSGGPVVARSSTVFPCPAVPSGSLSGLHLPSFSTNLVSTAALQDAMVTTTTPGGQRVLICTCTRTGRHLATFTRRPGSSLYTLATEPPQVAVSAQVSASGQVAASCSCRLLSNRNLLWHHRLGHPSLPRLRGMHSRLLVSGLPRSLPPLPPSPEPPCLPCVEGRQRAAPHSSSFPLTTAPLQTLHMDDLLVLRLHSNIGGEFFSNLLWEFCHGEGILQSMEVARTSMIHAVAPHFLWPFAVRCAAHQLNLWPRISLSETSPTLRWTGEVGNASVFRFYHPTSRRVLPSQDITFDESVPFYRLFPYRSAPPPPPPLFLAPGPPPGAQLGGEEPGGAEPGGAEPEGVEPGGAELEGAESGGAEPRGAASSGGPAGASPQLSPQQLRAWLVLRARLRSGASGAGGAGDARAGGAGFTDRAGGTGGTVAAGPGGARTRGAGAVGFGGVGSAGAGDPAEPGVAGGGGSCAGDAGARGAGARGAGVGGTGTGGAGAAGVGAVDPGAGGTVRPRPYFVPSLQQVLGVPSSTSLTPPLLCPPPDQSQPPLLSPSPLPAPSPYTEQSGGLRERREPTSHPVSPARTAHRVPRLRPPPILGTHAMALPPSFVPLHVPLPAPPASSLPEVPDSKSDRARAAIPTVSHLLATAITNPSFESAAASSLIAELLEFAAACRLDYATALVP